MYLFLGVLIGFGSILLLNVVGVLISRKKNEASTILVTSLIASVIYTLIIFFVRWSNSDPIYGPTPLFAWIIIGAIMAFIIPLLINEGDDFRQAVPGLLTFIILLIWVAIIWIGGWDMNESTNKGKLFEVDVKKVNSKIMDLADPSHICLVNEDMARSKAEKALGQVKTEDNANAGSRYDLGDGTKQFVDGQLWWIFPLEFISYWQWKRFPTSPGFIRVSAEDVMGEAQAIQTDKFGKPIVIKYLNSAYFGSLAKRYLRNNGYKKSNIQDFTFEVDDNWRPYYSISQREWTIGYGASKVTNLILLDVQTGEIETCPISDVKSNFPWVDRANDLDVIDYQSNKWGKYSEVGWRLTSIYNGKRKKTTPGWYMTYDDGNCYWFTGWTSYSSSSDLIGVSLTDANTGKTVYYPTQGSTEDVAYQIAQSHWSNFVDYIPTELVIYSFYGTLTYVIPMAYQSTQFVGVSLVSVMNKDVNAKGKTLEEALSAYRSSMASVTSDRGVPYEGQPQNLEIRAKIAEVGMPFLQGTSHVHPFRLENIDKIFQVSYSLQNAKVSFLKPGRNVVLTYMDTKEKVITCLTFDLPDITLTDQNPAQARWVENQKIVRTEEKRVNNTQENQSILEDENLGNINPDSLKKFIESQNKDATK